MSTTIVVSAARRLTGEARTRRARLGMQDPERHFYLGVEAAAQDLLHPEVRDARPEAWLDREHASFREGYLRTSILLASAATSGRVTLVGVPEFP